VKRLAFALGIAAAAVAQKLDKAERFFDTRVAPILSKRCLECHNQELKNGNISFLDSASLKRAIVPGKPDESVLITVLRHEGQIQMPPGPKLPPKEIAILTEWVRRGAVWGTKLRLGR
jgi:hypothetical protein